MIAEVRVALDSSPAVAAIEEFALHLPKLRESSLDVVEAFLSLVDAGGKLFVFKNDRGPAGTNDLVVRLEPSDGFVMFLAAIRAGQIHGLQVELLKHPDFSLVGCVATPTLTESPAVRKDAGDDVNSEDGEIE